MARFVLGLALVAALLGAGCGAVDVPDHPDPLDHRSNDETPTNGETAGAAQELRLHTDGLKFAPVELTAVAGATARLTLENGDEVEHDFQIDEIDVRVIQGEDEQREHVGGHAGGLSVHADGGESDSVMFVVNEPGSYEFYCTVTGHRESGMVGTLKVE